MITVKAIRCIQKRMAELRKVEAIKVGLADMIDFDARQISDSIAGQDHEINVMNLQYWFGFQGFGIDFGKVIQFIQQQQSIYQPLQQQNSLGISKDEFVEFLKPQKLKSPELLNTFSSADQFIQEHQRIKQLNQKFSGGLNNEQRKIRENLHYMSLLNLFKTIGSDSFHSTSKSAPYDQREEDELFLLWSDSFGAHAQSVPIQTLKTWMERQYALYLPNSEMWLLRDCFGARSMSDGPGSEREVVVTRNSFMEAIRGFGQ